MGTLRYPHMFKTPDELVLKMAWLDCGIKTYRNHTVAYVLVQEFEWG